jgi:hypothetical protein
VLKRGWGGGLFICRIGGLENKGGGDEGERHEVGREGGLDFDFGFLGKRKGGGPVCV